MATTSITRRKRKSGFVYVAEIAVYNKGTQTHYESRTFKKRANASEWLRIQENAVDDPKFRRELKHNKVTLSELIDRYVDEYGTVVRFERSKSAGLAYLQKTELGNKTAFELTSDVLIDHIRQRRNEGVSGSTANNDLVWLRVVCKTAVAAWKIPIDLTEIESAFIFCRSNGLIGRPKKRDRRPTKAELKKLSDYFKSRDERAAIPMHDIMWFAIYSGRREAEITRILKSDNNTKEKTGIVRDHKHPRQKTGNHKRFKYTNEAWKLIKKQKGDDDRIFPYNPKSVSSAFTKSCQACGIEDLRFHDLRHEATSRLFEQGYSITEVQQFTLHEDWNMLRRYTHIDPGKVKLR